MGDYESVAEAIVTAQHIPQPHPLLKESFLWARPLLFLVP